MGNKIIRIIAIALLLFGINGCEYFEMRGFLLSYETVDERFEQSMTWNNNHPFKVIPVSNDDYYIYVMGDSHLGTATNFNIFLNAARHDHAVATVMVGDLSRGNDYDYEYLDQNIPHPDSLLTFQLVGNHDLYFDGWKQFYQRFGSSVYFFTVKTPIATDLYICLDSGGGTLGAKQLEWFQNLLQKDRKKYRHCIVFSHVNIFRIRSTINANPYPGEVMALAELCLEHNVNMVFNGHDHINNVEIFGPTTFITMDALVDGYLFAGYSIVKNSGGKLSFENVRL